MPSLENRFYLDFEKPIKDINDQILKLEKVEKETGVDLSSEIDALEKKCTQVKKEVTKNLSPWQRVQLSRHPDRPYTLKYIQKMCSAFQELHGDRNFGDDKAMVGGFGTIDGKTFMIIGQQKGYNTKLRQYRNFGMANPEGYRKALRLMKLAEKFNIPILTLIDTPGAYPGIEAEERGQGEAIARNIYEMLMLKVPFISVIIGEGASGGALGIAVADKVAMMENTWYTVISPESCSSILWHSWDKKETAAQELKLTSKDMLGFNLVDAAVTEPPGGAHYDYDEAAAYVKKYVLETLTELQKDTVEDRIQKRLKKYEGMGFWKE